MNRDLARALRPVFADLRRRHAESWWQLKREIWEGGLGLDYPALGDFDVMAALRRLGSDQRSEILGALRSNDCKLSDADDERMISVAAAMVMETLVVRAERAAMRTVNW